MADQPVPSMLGALLSPMKGMGGIDPATQGGFGTPSSPIQNLSRQMAPMRAMRYLRAQAPSPLRQPQQRNGPSPISMPEGDLSQFTYDPSAHAAATSAGINPLSPSQVNPNAFLPNTGFFGAHHRIAGAIEGGLLGAAGAQG